MSGGGKTVWGDPAEIGKVVEGASFDVVLDNNGKDIDTVRCVKFYFSFSCFLVDYVIFSTVKDRKNT